MNEAERMARSSQDIAAVMKTFAKIEHLILLSVLKTIAMAESAHMHDQLSMDLRKYFREAGSTPAKRISVDEPPTE